MRYEIGDDGRLYSVWTGRDGEHWTLIGDKVQNDYNEDIENFEDRYY